MSVAERGYDPGRLLFEVYDHHQPSTGTDISSVEALAVRTLVALAMIRCRNRCENCIEVRCHLAVADLRIQNMVVPRVGEDDNADPVGRRGLANDWSLGHANARSTASASWSLGW